MRCRQPVSNIEVEAADKRTRCSQTPFRSETSVRQMSSSNGTT